MNLAEYLTARKKLKEAAREKQWRDSALYRASERYANASPKIVSFETQVVGHILTTLALDEDGKLWHSCKLDEFFTEWLPYPSLPKRNAKVKPQVPEQPNFVTGDGKP